MKLFMVGLALVTVSVVGCNEHTTVALPASSPQVVAQDLLPHRVIPVAEPSKPAEKKPVTTKRNRPTQRVTKHTPKRASRSRSTQQLTGSSVWDRLAACESGGNWSINTGNGYYGGLQFSLSSWRAVGGSGLPSNASRSEQIRRGEILRSSQGWGAWPACSRKLGLR